MTVGLSDATWVAGLLALGGSDLGGALVSESVAESFGAAYANATGPEGALRAVPSSLAVDALTGSIDLAATLAFGKPVYTEGLLVTQPRLLVRRAERLDSACASLLAQALDREAMLLIAVMDVNDPEAALPAKLEARLPFVVTDEAEPHWTPQAIADARLRMHGDDVDPRWINELCAAAFSIGITSPRAVLQTLKAARGVAALQGRNAVDEESVALAARLVLSHRAQYAPQQSEEQQDQEPPPPPPDGDDETNAAPPNPGDAEIILEAIKAALPANLLLMASDGLGKRGAGRNIKSAAPRKAAGQRGRRVGNKRASSLAGQRLDILATLRNAAPWQPLRRKTGIDRMIVTRDDFRVSRIKQRNEATAIFAVDASGSTAFQRLAEAKGAVETILAECYVRRDKVALVAFRGKKAEVLLSPTRSLERAKRSLSGLPGGGGTPLASGLHEAFTLAVQVKRSGGNPIVIMLTDGRGNVTRDGEGNKVKALEESDAAAKLFAAEGFDALVIDVSPEPQKAARALAQAMHATYLPMPRASANDIAQPVRQALKSVSA
jgi:magnesium chelatase subunit D